MGTQLSRMERCWCLATNSSQMELCRFSQERSQLACMRRVSRKERPCKPFWRSGRSAPSAATRPASAAAARTRLPSSGRAYTGPAARPPRSRQPTPLRSRIFSIIICTCAWLREDTGHAKDLQPCTSHANAWLRIDIRHAAAVRISRMSLVESPARGRREPFCGAPAASLGCRRGRSCALKSTSMLQQNPAMRTSSSLPPVSKRKARRQHPSSTYSGLPPGAG
jgi:hypothetical protein